MNSSPVPDIPLAHAGAVLSIDLAAIVANYRTLRGRLGSAVCSAVVKSDAYGTGAGQVAPALAEAGCEVFFVAHIEEGMQLRGVLPTAEIHILNGLFPDALSTYKAFNLIPVLGSLEEVTSWKDYCGAAPLPCDLHVDTGMLRLGLPPQELARIADDPNLIAGLDIRNVISHLASADEADSPQNARQLNAFRKVREIIPAGRASFSNSSGIFLGSDYHFDLARPGVALYGGNPTPDKPNPMLAAVSLRARIVQVRSADTPETVGYGAAYGVNGPTRIATVPVGYADGMLRSFSDNSCGYIGDHPVPLIGRVSMDLITYDVTNVPESASAPGNWIDIIGPKQSIDEFAKGADTISYEILTSLGRRYHRVYKSA